MVKAVIFDFGGVVGSDSDAWDINFLEIKKLTGLSCVQLEKFFIKHWKKLKIGKEDTVDFWKDIITSKNLKIPPEKLEKTYLPKITINNDVLDIVENIKLKGVLVTLLPNTARQWMDFKVKKFKLDQIFDKIYSSAHLGIAKPEPEIFEYALKDLNLAPEEVIFIDNQQNNVNSAKKLGIKAILFVNSQQLNKDLTNFGIL